MKLSFVAGLMAMLVPAVAQAHWHGRVGLSFGIGIGPGYYCAPPVYYAPPPVVYYGAAAAVYAPPPVVTYSAPVTVYAAPPVVTYQAPPVVYGPAVTVYGGPVVGFRYYGHTHYGYRHR